MEDRHLCSHHPAGPGEMKMTGQNPPDNATRNLVIPAFLIVVGAVVAFYGVMVTPERTWPSLLLNGFYFSSLALSAVFFLAVTRLAGARWSAGLRRIPEEIG